MNQESDTPWIALTELIATGNGAEVERCIDELPPGDVSRVIDRLGPEPREQLFHLLSPERASHLLDDLSQTQAVDVLEHLEAAETAAIVTEMPAAIRADLLGDMADEQTEAVLAEMTEADAEQARDLLVYPEDAAGGLMQLEFLQFNESNTVQDVLDDLRQHAATYSDFDVQYAYVVDEHERLRGVLRMRDLLLSEAGVKLPTLMIPDPVRVTHLLPLQELRGFFDEKDYIGLPVTDEADRLLGVVLRKSVYEASTEAAAEDFLKVAGLGKEELRSMPLRTRSGRRLSWLSVNILLNVVAASVIAFYQDTLAQVIALAVFLPIISDMSGCSGSQAVAVSIRELTMGLVRPPELLRVLGKELSIGLINGLALGILLAAVAFFWKGNPWLGLVVGAALMVNTTVAVCLGGSIPLVLKRFDLDPALASGPILTTVTDMCGFFLVLSLATTVLPRLI